MKKEIKRLPDEHLAAAKAMVPRHKKKKNCKRCFDRGYEGINEENMLIPCRYCVDGKALFDEWKAYVYARPELKELYGDSLEDEKPATEPAAK